MDRKQLNELHEFQSAEYAMKWYGWGSPIGLSIFFLALTLIGAIITFLVRFPFACK
jgi:hypothetical protein